MTASVVRCSERTARAENLTLPAILLQAEQFDASFLQRLCLPTVQICSVQSIVWQLHRLFGVEYIFSEFYLEFGEKSLLWTLVTEGCSRRINNCRCRTVGGRFRNISDKCTAWCHADFRSCGNRNHGERCFQRADRPLGEARKGHSHFTAETTSSALSTNFRKDHGRDTRKGHGQTEERIFRLLYLNRVFPTLVA